jgi:hypothetical protein
VAALSKCCLPRITGSGLDESFTRVTRAVGAALDAMGAQADRHNPHWWSMSS